MKVSKFFSYSRQDMQRSAQTKIDNDKYYHEESKLITESGKFKTKYVSFVDDVPTQTQDDEATVSLEDHHSRTEIVEISSDTDNTYYLK